MALSLSEISLLSIVQGIKDGRIKRVDHIVWPHFRQSILDFVLMRCGVTDPNCLKVVTSPEFFNGMTSIDTQSAYKDRNSPNRDYETDDHELLDSIAISLATVTSEGKTLGSKIVELKLNVYVSTINELTLETNFQSVVRVIAQCPKLRSLELRLVEASWTVDNENDQQVESIWADDFPIIGLLNRMEAWEPCRSIIENVVSLSVISAPGSRLPELFRCDHFPQLQFKNLVNLRLAWCEAKNTAWASFLNSVKETLELLVIHQFIVRDPHNLPSPQVLPIALPNVKRIIQRDPIVCVDRSTVTNLLQCPKLESVALSVNSADIPYNLDDLIRSKSVDVDFWIESEILTNNDWIDLFGENIKRLCWGKQPEISATIVRRFVERCPNLKAINFDFSWMFGDDDDNEDIADKWNLVADCNMELTPLFQDVDRASKLEYLHLAGQFDENALAALFKNCVNLNTLKMFICHQLWDAHLIEFARRGGLLEKLHFDNCSMVTDKGFVPLLISSGRRIQSFQVYRIEDEDDEDEDGDDQNEDKFTDRTWEILIDRCRYLQKGNIPENLTEMARSKLFFRSLYL